MTADQTSFAKAVQHLGLERGIERSKATHTSIKQHYAAIERGTKGEVTITPEAVQPRVLKKGFLTKEVESPDQIAERLTDAINKGHAGTVANAAVSAQNARRNRELQETMVGQRERIKALQEPFQGLSREQFKELVIAAAGMRRENEAAKAAKLQRQKERRQERPDRGRGFSR
ncbi:mobilization domain protein [Providencia sp. MGF014]|nr:mobilization domain protein [Providencia sp. MGF014]